MSATLTLHAAKRCAAHHGMRVEQLGPDAPQWTGEAINMFVLVKQQREDARRHSLCRARLSVARRILHEVGHFLVAPMERRHVVNYGMGASPWDSSRVIRDEEAQAEDAAAMLLAVALEASLVSVEEALETFADQGWSGGMFYAPEWHKERTLSLFWPNIARLNAAGLLIGATAAPQLVPHHHRRARHLATRAA